MEADSSAQGKVMWARIRGKTENELFKLPFKAVHIFRPGFIQPLHGIQSKTPLYRMFYSVLQPVMPLMRKFFPNRVATTQSIGLAMLEVAARGTEHKILFTENFEQLAHKRVD